MSKTTLRKRIALTAVSALVAGMLTVASAPVASAAAQSSHTNAGGTTMDAASSGITNQSMFTSVVASTGTGAALPADNAGASATQKGLLSKDSSSGTAQTATILAGGQVAFYAMTTTVAAFTATGGTFSSAGNIENALETVVYNSSNTAALITFSGATSLIATTTATLWTAPTTPGTYTVNLLTGYYTNSSGVLTIPTISILPPTLGASILVTVVASSAGGSYSASRSACKVDTAGSTSFAYSSSTPASDTTATFVDGDSAYILYDLNDVYTQNLDTGNITVTATNGGLVNVSAAASLVAGTSSTAILSSDGTSDSVRVSQPTAGAPLTTTVTISYNGTTVCTKTITIRGEVAKLTIGNIATQALSTASSVNGEQWMYQQTGLYRAGQFTVVATDSAGNVVDTTSALGSYAAASGTGAQVSAITINSRSSTSNASSPLAYNFGGFTCGATAGQANVSIKFTTTSTGKSVTSDPFVARCADTAATYTVSLDKAAYSQGEIAKATVQFLDSKGNKANNMVAIGANSWVLPYMTAVDSTITATTGASSTSVTKADGSVVYTFTVGTSTAAVAGTYTGVVSFSAPALGVNATPTYKLSTGGDTTTNADVLKSIVALIASINKQIQALQKLILKR
jgi:hypothetical protein